MSDTPFVPGARCAIELGGGVYREAFVDRAYKSGRFTLVGGGGQQWRPFIYSDPNSYWQAIETGDYWRRATLSIWDQSTDERIREGIAKETRRRRLITIQRRIENLHTSEMTDAVLTALEAALPPKPEALAKASPPALNALSAKIEQEHAE